MSSKRQKRWKQCGRKVRHETEAAALAAIHHLRRKGKFAGRSNTYRCEFCGGYHFGHALR